MKLSQTGTQKMQDFIEQHKDQDAFKKMNIRDMLNAFVKDGVKVKIQYISGNWVDVNNISDLTSASRI